MYNTPQLKKISLTYFKGSSSSSDRVSGRLVVFDNFFGGDGVNFGLWVPSEEV